MSTTTLTHPTTRGCVRPLLREHASALVSSARMRSLVVLDSAELPADTLRDVGSLVRLCGGEVTLLRVLEPRSWIDALDDPLTEIAIVLSASPLVASLDTLRRMEDAGAGAIVLPSLFEEQINTIKITAARDVTR
jgi:hypothetical protein